MGTNGFREDELFTETVNGQTREFPVVGGRLRLAHEENQSLNLQTEMVNWDGQYAIFKCSAITNKGQFVGYGTANSQRDARLAESLTELSFRKHLKIILRETTICLVRRKPCLRTSMTTTAFVGVTG